MVLFLSLLTIFLTFVAVAFNWQRNRAVALLAGFVSSYTLFIITHQVVVYQKNEIAFALLYNHFTPLFYLAGPFLYWYFRALVEDDLRFRTSDLVHLIPAALNLIGIVPYLLSPWSEKLEIARQIIANFDVYKTIQANWLIPVDLNNVLRPVVLIGYTIASLRLLSELKIPARVSADHPLGIHYKKTRQWSILVLSTVMLMVISYLIPLFLYLDQGIEVALNKAMIWQIVAAALFALLPASLILYPNVIYGFVRFEGDVISVSNLTGLHSLTREPLTKNAPSESGSSRGKGASETPAPSSDAPQLSARASNVPPPNTPSKSTKTAKTAAESSFKSLELLKEAILSYLEEDKPFLNPDFKAHDIARHLNVPAHHISYCFSQCFDENFSQLKTGYRLKHARTLLGSGASDQFTIEGVGRQSGFASKSSFFTAFREAEGVTPQQYIERLKQGEKV